MITEFLRAALVEAGFARASCRSSSAKVRPAVPSMPALRKLRRLGMKLLRKSTHPNESAPRRIIGGTPGEAKAEKSAWQDGPAKPALAGRWTRFWPIDLSLTPARRYGQPDLVNKHCSQAPEWPLDSKSSFGQMGPWVSDGGRLADAATLPRTLLVPPGRPRD